MEYGHEKCKKALIYDGFYMWSDSIVKSALNITRTEKDLSAMTIFQKSVYLRNYSKEVHRTNSNDVFYCYYARPDTVVSYYPNTKIYFL